MATITLKVTDLTDKNAFLAQAGEAFDREVTNARADHETIGKVIMGFYSREDVKRGIKVPQSFLKNLVITELKPGPSEMSTVDKRFAAYMEENCSSEKADGKLLGCVKGRDGGTFLWADHVEKAKK